MNIDTFRRLLKYPHAAVFDKSPSAELALRIRNPLGLVWTVEGRVLRLVVGENAVWDGEIVFDGSYDFGLTQREYSLAGKTIGQLADELRADGHEVAFENPDLAQRDARVLIAGSANQADTNGDHLNGYTSLLWVMLGAYSVELAEARHQSEQALRQMVMTQSEGEWLDVWTTIYGVPRLADELDPALQIRLPQEVFRARVNGLAIEQAITDLAGQSVTIDEPWKRMFILDESALSGSHRIQDGYYHTYHVIQPVGAEGTDWSKVYPVIERNRAAGIEIYAPRIHHPARHIEVEPQVEYRVEFARTDVRGLGLLSANDWVLGNLVLDESAPSINHPCARHDHAVLSEADGFQTAQQIEPHRTVAMAAIALSDGEPLGDENTILSRGAVRVDFDPAPVPSDLMYLSGYDAVQTVELVEQVMTVQNAASVDYPFAAVEGEVQRTDIRSYGMSEEAYPLRFWVGGWGTYQWIPEWRNSGMLMTETSI